MREGRDIVRNLHVIGDMFMTRPGRCAAAVGLALTLLCAAAPASAQVELSGVWQPRYHEDQPERIPGPELRDYLGLPINEIGRAHV